MSEDQEKSSKTEEPTRKRIDDAVKKGQVATSREVNSFFILLALTVLVIMLIPGMMTDLKPLLAVFITDADDFSLDDTGIFQRNMQHLLSKIGIIMAVPALLVIASIFAANMVQNRYVFSTEPIKPKFEKISPLAGIKRLFSRKTLIEFIKGLIKISVVGGVATAAVWPYKEEMRLLADQEMMELMHFTATVSARMLIGVCCAMLLIALIDFAYQKFEYMQNLRMTKQEVKDEYKQQEGDPMVKQRLRQIRREKAQKRMMEAVPQADVVITNPTHYAVALQYDTLRMAAPMVVAKGVDKVALRIKERAEQHKVTIVRNPPLARLLFDNAEMDEEIPLEYYRAVAEVIGYVYKIKGMQFRKGK